MEGTSLNNNATMAPTILCRLWVLCWQKSCWTATFFRPAHLWSWRGTSCLPEEKWNIQTSAQSSVGDVTPPILHDPVTSGMTNQPQVCESGDLVSATEALPTNYDGTDVLRNLAIFVCLCVLVCVSVCVCLFSSLESDREIVVFVALYKHNTNV